MMVRRIALEEFDLTESSELPLEVPPPLNEEVKLEAFEQGYKAGWDDASIAQNQDQARITADLESNLKDLSFTFHEARAHILQGIDPLIRELVETVLPSFAHEGLPFLVAERLGKAINESSERPIILNVSPNTRSAVEAALPKDPGFPISIREEETLGEGQVFLNLGAKEELLDVDDAMASVKSAILEFFELNQRLQANG